MKEKAVVLLITPISKKPMPNFKDCAGCKPLRGDYAYEVELWKRTVIEELQRLNDEDNRRTGEDASHGDKLYYSGRINARKDVLGKKEEGKGETRMTAFRSKMRVGISSAEDQLHIALTQRKLTKDMQRNVKVSLDWNLAEDRANWTEPDFYWLKHRLALYLDGYRVHRTEGAKQRDERITETLEEQGHTVLRYTYKGKLSRNMEREICRKVEAILYPI